jgi:Cft2 family RNA processing exonuclease
MFISCYASGSAGNLYKIENNKTTLLIECGLPMKDIRHCLGTTIDNVEAVLLTHEHKDHSKAIHEFLRLGIDNLYQQRNSDCLWGGEKPLRAFYRK